VRKINIVFFFSVLSHEKSPLNAPNHVCASLIEIFFSPEGDCDDCCPVGRRYP
jgi:hypothetical protein